MARLEVRGARRRVISSYLETKGMYLDLID
jgi:hypothetical protein